jgi:hypothetical protein
MMLNLVEDNPSASTAREIKSVILGNLPAYKPYSSTDLQFIIRKLVIYPMSILLPFSTNVV